MSHASSPPSGPSSTPAPSAWLGRGLLTGPGVTAGTGRLWLARGWPGGPGDVTCCLRLLSPAWDSQPASGRARAQRWVRQIDKHRCYVLPGVKEPSASWCVSFTRFWVSFSQLEPSTGCLSNAASAAEPGVQTRTSARATAATQRPGKGGKNQGENERLSGNLNPRTRHLSPNYCHRGEMTRQPF